MHWRNRGETKCPEQSEWEESRESRGFCGLRGQVVPHGPHGEVVGFIPRVLGSLGRVWSQRKRDVIRFILQVPG